MDKSKVGKLMTWSLLVQCKEFDLDRVNAVAQASHVFFKIILKYLRIDQILIVIYMNS